MLSWTKCCLLFPVLVLTTGCWEATGVPDSDTGAAVAGAGAAGTNGGGGGGGGGGGASDTGVGVGDGGDDGGGNSQSDACDWPEVGICFAFTGHDQTASWCEQIGATYDIATSYDDGCAGGAVARCDLSDVGGEFPSGPEITGHYYGPNFNASSAADACAGSGGSPL